MSRLTFAKYGVKLAAVTPSIKLIADSTADDFHEVLELVRCVCDAVFDGYHFEVEACELARIPSRRRGPVLIATFGTYSRRIADCVEAETLIVKLEDFKARSRQECPIQQQAKSAIDSR